MKKNTRNIIVIASIAILLTAALLFVAMRSAYAITKPVETEEVNDNYPIVTIPEVRGSSNIVVEEVISGDKVEATSVSSFL